MRKLAVVLSLLVAACGDDDPVRHLDGGMTVDSPMQMIDAPVIPEPVSLTIMLDGLPQEGIVVHFQNSDSTVVATAMTDATGTVSQIMNAGGYVTAMDPYHEPSGVLSYEVYTFAGVKPGDHLHLAEDNSFMQLTATLPLETDPAINYYEVYTPCSQSFMNSAGSGNTPSGPVYLFGCSMATDFLVAAYDGNGAVISSFFVAGQAVSDGGTLDFSTQTYVAPTDRTYTFTNVPEGATIDVHDHLISTKGQLADIFGTASGDPATGTVAIPTFTNAFTVVEGMYSNGQTVHASVDWGPFASTYSVADFAARMLVDFTASPGFDATTHKITWTEGSGVAPDFTVATASAYRPNDAREVRWHIVAPYIAGSITYPVVPSSPYDVNFTTDDTVNVEELRVAKMPGGYDAVRANVYVADGPAGLTPSATGSAQYAMSGGERGRRIKAQPWFKHRGDVSHAEPATTRTPTPKRALTGRRK